MWYWRSSGGENDLLLWREKVTLLFGLRAIGEVGSGLVQPVVLVGEDETEERNQKAIKQGSIVMESFESQTSPKLVGTQCKSELSGKVGR